MSTDEVVNTTENESVQFEEETTQTDDDNNINELSNKSTTSPTHRIDNTEPLPTKEVSVEPESDASIDPTPEQPETITSAEDQTNSQQQLQLLPQKPPLAVPEPNVPQLQQKKKRLTLQERLALAANKGGKKPIKKLRDSSSEATPRTSIDMQERPSIELELNETDLRKTSSDNNGENDEQLATATTTTDLLPSNYIELDHDALLEVLKTALEKFSKLKESLDREKSSTEELRSKLTSRESELKQKESKLSELSKKSATDSNASKKLEEKDNMIKELMEEGSKLSMKELTLSNTIKSLKKKSSDDTQLISELQEKLDRTMVKLATFEQKEIEFKEFDTKKEKFDLDFKSLEDKHAKLQEQFDKISQEYKDLKSQRFEQQLETTREKLNEQTKKNKDLSQKLDELKIRLKLSKDQSKNELDELEEKIRREQKRYQLLQEENANEIKRLEDKMEQLRIMTESSTTSKNDDLGNESFKKLAASNELLQSQYTLAQENWKFIESSYMNKLALAEKDINTLKQKDLNSMKKIKLFASDLKAKNDELEESVEREGQLVGDIAILQKTLKQKDIELEDLQMEIKSLTQEFEDYKIEFSQKMQDELASQKDTYERELEQLQANKSFDGPLQQQLLYLNDLLPNPSFLKTRSVSNMSWNDNIAFGESSTTPRSSHVNSRKPSSSFLNQFGAPPGNNNSNPNFNSNNNPLRTPVNESSARFFESPKAIESPLHGYENFFNSTQKEESFFDDEYGDDYRAQSPTSLTSSKGTLNRDSQLQRSAGMMNVARSTSGVTVNNKHIQIIGKLSAQIRRMEIETVTLKDEIENLNNLKNESNEEILRLLKENSEVQDLKNDRGLLEKQVADLDKKYQKTLELLGEKSERVEELKADVEDLKELCREQVQQLVELQMREK